MWAQKWDSLIDIVWTEADDMHFHHPHFKHHDGKETTGKSSESTASSSSLVKKILPPNATVIDMVKQAENFFVSMGNTLINNNNQSSWKIIPTTFLICCFKTQ